MGAALVNILFALPFRKKALPAVREKGFFTARQSLAMNGFLQRFALMRSKSNASKPLLTKSVDFSTPSTSSSSSSRSSTRGCGERDRTVSFYLAFPD